MFAAKAGKLLKKFGSRIAARMGDGGDNIDRAASGVLHPRAADAPPTPAAPHHRQRGSGGGGGGGDQEVGPHSGIKACDTLILADAMLVQTESAATRGNIAMVRTAQCALCALASGAARSNLHIVVSSASMHLHVALSELVMGWVHECT